MAQASRETEIALRLHSAAIRLLRTLRKRDTAMGLSPARASVLSILVFAGPRTLKQLAEAEQVAAPTMTKLVNGLQQAGLVRRTAQTDDARSWVIHPTARARLLLEKGRQQRIELLLALLRGNSRAEWVALETAAAVLEKRLRTS